ncbi:MAG: hypothetical protein KQI62_21420 [Deltaproteobacteria bacterium]|nr:hypothetical protein [Deltaproteobacteria bacterium]
MAEELEKWLFRELYDEVLLQSEQHMLRLCSLYRDKISHLHIKALNNGVQDQDAFIQLVRRCLLTSNETEEWYYIHSIIQDLTQRRIDKESDSFFSDHEIIADAWLAQLKISGSLSSLPNIKATNEAFFHLSQAQSYSKFHMLSHKLLNRGIIPQLEQLSRVLSRKGTIDDNRHVLELIVKIDPKNHKAHRFLGETLEKLMGRGNEEAMSHYQMAYNLNHSKATGRTLLTRI